MNSNVNIFEAIAKGVVTHILRTNTSLKALQGLPVPTVLWFIRKLLIKTKLWVCLIP